MSGLFVTGTDTGVGKTVVAGAVALALRDRGLDVGVCKPVQSGALAADPAGDAMLLLGWTGVRDAPGEVCPHSFPEPVAPLVAARLAGEELDCDEVCERVRVLAARHDALVVEGAGGLYVPVGEQWTVGELAAKLAYPALVVARPGLGTVNHTLLTVVAARRLGIDVLGVVLNGDDPLAADNAAMIERFGDVPVLGRTPLLDRPPTRDALRSLAAALRLDRVAAALGGDAVAPEPRQAVERERRGQRG